MKLLSSLPALYKNLAISGTNRLKVGNLPQILYKSSSKKYDLDLKIQGISLQNYIKQLEEEYSVLLKQQTPAAMPRLLELEPIINILSERNERVKNINNLSDLLKDTDTEIKTLAQEEQTQFENEIKILDEELLEAMLPQNKEDFYKSIVLEVNTGVGGQEAMIFAKELFEMYCNFCEFKGTNKILKNSFNTNYFKVGNYK